MRGPCKRASSVWIFPLAFALWFAATLPAQEQARAGAEQNFPWGEWLEDDFPFISSVLDARQKGDPLLKENLTPRALILNMGGGLWAGFDTELLRVAAIWQGRAVTPAALGPLTYRDPYNRTGGARAKLPAPVGVVWLANGLFPGWQRGREISTLDPREPTPSKNEVGRGPLAEEAGRFRALHLLKEGGVELRYTLGDVPVVDRLRAVDGRVRRELRVGAATEELLLVVATRAPGAPAKVTLPADANPALRIDDTGPVTFVRVAPRAEPVEFAVWLAPGDAAALPAATAATPSTAPRWPQVLTTRATLSTAKDAFVADDIPLPVDNPWRRHLRLGDLQFFPDGRAAGVTIDGDVWLIDGLAGDLGEVRWRRFASGLHEPLSIAIRDGEIFVFDRSGLWRLRDTDGDGEADVHEMFCNLFAQTADTREFANNMKLAPDGSFVLAKGGQRGGTLAKDSGTVLRIAPDGKSVTTLGWGFRQPYVGVHPRTGMVTASDQEGNYVPATPIFVLEKNEYHGFLAGFLPEEKYPAPIAQPVVWLPHTFNASGVSQLWLTDARMGPLNDALIHVGYNRAELFVVRLSERTAERQAAVMSLTRDLPYSLLAGAVNPADGQLYVTGFQIYAATAERISGLTRIRHTGAEYTQPREIAAMDQGVMLRFDVALDEKRALDLVNYRIARWNYKRAASYGSPHYRPDGELGQEAMLPSSVYLSRDRRSVFVGIADMRADVMQMQVGWTLATATGAVVESEAFLTPRALARFAPAAEGFDEIAVDLTPRKLAGQATVAALTVADGQKLAEAYACLACHSTDGSPKVGPTWQGLPGSLRKLKGGKQVVADDAYLRESILFSSAKIVEGSDEGMPAYAGILNDQQVDAVILYLKSLQTTPTPP